MNVKIQHWNTMKILGIRLYNLYSGNRKFFNQVFETLMMGRIPVFIDTDCLLPFPNLVNWQDHMIWIKWSDIELLPKLILNSMNRLLMSISDKFKK